MKEFTVTYTSLLSLHTKGRLITDSACSPPIILSLNLANPGLDRKVQRALEKIVQKELEKSIRSHDQTSQFITH